MRSEINLAAMDLKISVPKRNTGYMPVHQAVVFTGSRMLAYYVSRRNVGEERNGVEENPPAFVKALRDTRHTLSHLIIITNLCYHCS